MRFQSKRLLEPASSHMIWCPSLLCAESPEIWMPKSFIRSYSGFRIRKYYQVIQILNYSSTYPSVPPPSPVSIPLTPKSAFTPDRQVAGPSSRCHSHLYTAERRKNWIYAFLSLSTAKPSRSHTTCTVPASQSPVPRILVAVPRRDR